MGEVVLTREKGNEESLTGIKMKKGRMINSKGKWRILYYGPKGGVNYGSKGAIKNSQTKVV